MHYTSIMNAPFSRVSISEDTGNCRAHEEENSRSPGFLMTPGGRPSTRSALILLAVRLHDDWRPTDPSNTYGSKHPLNQKKRLTSSSSLLVPPLSLNSTDAFSFCPHRAPYMILFLWNAPPAVMSETERDNQRPGLPCHQE